MQKSDVDLLVGFSGCILEIRLAMGWTRQQPPKFGAKRNRTANDVTTFENFLSRIVFFFRLFFSGFWIWRLPRKQRDNKQKYKSWSSNRTLLRTPPPPLCVSPLARPIQAPSDLLQKKSFLCKAEILGVGVATPFQILRFACFPDKPTQRTLPY